MSSAASTKNGFEEFEDTPSVQAHEDSFSIPEAAVDITKDLANSKLLAKSNKVTDSTKISQLSGMGHLKSLAMATMKNIGKNIVEPSSQDEIKTQEGLSPQSNKKEERKSPGMNASESKRRQDNPGGSSSTTKNKLMARSSSQGTSAVKKRDIRRSKSLDVNTKLGIKANNNAGSRTPTGCERIPRRTKNSSTMERSSVVSSKSPSSMRRSSTTDRSNTASSKSPSIRRSSTAYRSNITSSKSPSLRRPSRRTSGAATFGATSPASGQSSRRHSVRSKAQIGNHQLQQVLRQPRYVPNVLSKNLDDADEEFVSDPYGHDVDEDSESELLNTVPKVIKNQHLPPVTTMSDHTTVDFTALDSASVHQVLRTLRMSLTKGMLCSRVQLVTAKLIY